MAITKKELIQFMDELVDLASEKNNGKNMEIPIEKTKAIVYNHNNRMKRGCEYGENVHK